MKKVQYLSWIFLVIGLVACGAQPAVNPVGTWSGMAEGSEEYQQGPVNLVVTAATEGVYEAVFTDELSGTVFSDLNCRVAGSNMVCKVNYGPELDNAFLEMEGPITKTTYTGSLRASLGGPGTTTGTFDLNRPAQP